MGLELRDRGQNPEHQLASRSRGVDGLIQHDETDLIRLQLCKNPVQVQGGPRQPVETGDYQDVAATDVAETFLQCRSGRGPAAEHFSRKISSQPYSCSRSSCTSRFCPMELTRAYPTVAMSQIVLGYRDCHYRTTWETRQSGHSGPSWEVHHRRQKNMVSAQMIQTSNFGPLPGKTRAICYNLSMNESTHHELSERLAVLEERMNTKSAENESALDRLRADMAQRDIEAGQRENRLRADMAQRDIEAGKRENRLLLAILGGLAAATAVLGVLITAQ